MTWKAVLDKKLACEHLDAGVTQITLPLGLNWFFDFHKPSIFARSCNRLLFDRMRSLKDDDQQEEIGVLLTGPPGIGKSWFLMYTIYRLAAEPSVPKIILHSAKDHTAYLFKPNGTVSKIRNPVGDDLRTVSDKDTWYLFDASEGGDECFPIGVFTIVTASPNRLHYKGFMKQVGTTKLFMPTWTYDEIATVTRRILPNRSDQELKEWYEHAGGVPRIHFGTKSKYLDFLTYQKEQMTNLSLDSVRILLESTSVPDSVGGRLSDAVVKSELADDDGGMFRKIKISYISDAVFADYVEARVVTHIAEIYAAVQFELHSHPGVGGSVFQNAFHAVVKRRHWINLKCVAFDNGVEGTSVDLEVDKIEYLKCESPEVEVCRQSSSKSNKYLVPMSTQHAFIDSILVTGNIVWCIQLTVAREKPEFTDRALTAYMRKHFASMVPNTLVPSKGLKKSDVDQGLDARFVFIVPSRHHFKTPAVSEKFYIAECSFAEYVAELKIAK